MLRAGIEGRTRMPNLTVRSDGRSASFTAPNGRAQQDMISAAISAAGIAAETFSCYEAHGTTTCERYDVEKEPLNMNIVRKVAHMGIDFIFLVSSQLELI